MNKKINLIFMSLIALAFLAAPVMAQGAWYMNGGSLILHLIETAIIIVAVVVAFKAAGMFAKDLGKAMKIVAFGLMISAVGSILDGSHNVGWNIFSSNLLVDSIIDHAIATIGFLVIAFGFYKIYNVAKGVAGKVNTSK